MNNIIITQDNNLTCVKNTKLNRKYYCSGKSKRGTSFIELDNNARITVFIIEHLLHV